MLKKLCKKVFILSLLVLSSLTFSSCDNETNDENIPEYYENTSITLPYIELAPNLSIKSKLKIDTEIQETKEAEIEFFKTIKSFIVDDPNLVSLSTKEILEMYSDFEQQLVFKITRTIKSGDDNYIYLDKYKEISEEIVFLKEDSIRYLIGDDFAKDFPKSFPITANELSLKNGRYFVVSYALNITPKNDEGIKLMRPASSEEVNNYEKSRSKELGINVGDSVNYIYYKKNLEIVIGTANYYKFYVKNNMINVLPYDISTIVY